MIIFDNFPLKTRILALARLYQTTFADRKTIKKLHQSQTLNYESFINQVLTLYKKNPTLVEKFLLSKKIHSFYQVPMNRTPRKKTNLVNILAIIITNGHCKNDNIIQLGLNIANPALPRKCLEFMLDNDLVHIEHFRRRYPNWILPSIFYEKIKDPIIMNEIERSFFAPQTAGHLQAYLPTDFLSYLRNQNLSPQTAETLIDRYRHQAGSQASINLTTVILIIQNLPYPISTTIAQKLLKTIDIIKENTNLKYEAITYLLTKTEIDFDFAARLHQEQKDFLFYNLESYQKIFHVIKNDCGYQEYLKTQNLQFSTLLTILDPKATYKLHQKLLKQYIDGFIVKTPVKK